MKCSKSQLAMRRKFVMLPSHLSSPDNGWTLSSCRSLTYHYHCTSLLPGPRLANTTHAFAARTTSSTLDIVSATEVGRKTQIGSGKMLHNTHFGQNIQIQLLAMLYTRGVQ